MTVRPENNPLLIDLQAQYPIVTCEFRGESFNAFGTDRLPWGGDLFYVFQVLARNCFPIMDNDFARYGAVALSPKPEELLNYLTQHAQIFLQGAGSNRAVATYDTDILTVCWGGSDPSRVPTLPIDYVAPMLQGVICEIETNFQYVGKGQTMEFNHEFPMLLHRIAYL